MVLDEDTGDEIAVVRMFVLPPHPDLTVEILTPKLMCWEVGALKGDQVET